MKKNKISLKHGYTLTINEEDKVFLKVETEDDTLEFDGIKGNLMDGSDFESHFDEEETEMTLAELIYGNTEFLKDWGVDEEVVTAIIEELTPWFERYAIEEPKPDAWEKVLEDRVAELKKEEASSKKAISDEARRFREWASNVDECDLIYDAIDKVQLLTKAREAYRLVWREYKRAESELYKYRQTMHIR